MDINREDKINELRTLISLRLTEMEHMTPSEVENSAPFAKQVKARQELKQLLHEQELEMKENGN